MRAMWIILGVFLIVVGAGFWATLGAEGAPGSGWAAIAPSLWAKAALPIIGLPIGAGLVLLLLSPGANATPVMPFWRTIERPALLLGATAAGAAVLLAMAASAQEVSGVTAALLLILGMGTLLALSYALKDMADGHGLGVESHWGGLGGSLGGWRLSPTITSFLLTAALIGATVAVAVGSDRQGTTGNTSVIAQAPAPVLQRETVRTGSGNSLAGNASGEAPPPPAASPPPGQAPPGPAGKQ